jgi:GDP-L-fucose synthase
MPTNLYGPNDNSDLETSHVLPALIRKFHEAKVGGKKQVEIWGTGTPRRELMHVDDLADACFFLMQNYENSNIINVGTGKDITIRELAAMVAKVAEFEGDMRFDTSKPDGTPLKRLDVSRLNKLGWQPRIEIEKGIRETYEWYLQSEQNLLINQI